MWFPVIYDDVFSIEIYYYGLLSYSGTLVCYIPIVRNNNSSINRFWPSVFIGGFPIATDGALCFLPNPPLSLFEVIGRCLLACPFYYFSSSSILPTISSVFRLYSISLFFASFSLILSNSSILLLSLYSSLSQASFKLFSYNRVLSISSNLLTSVSIWIFIYYSTLMWCLMSDSSLTNYSS